MTLPPSHHLTFSILHPPTRKSTRKQHAFLCASIYLCALWVCSYSTVCAFLGLWQRGCVIRLFEVGSRLVLVMGVSGFEKMDEMGVGSSWGLRSSVEWKGWVGGVCGGVGMGMGMGMGCFLHDVRMVRSRSGCDGYRGGDFWRSQSLEILSYWTERKSQDLPNFGDCGPPNAV